MSNYIDPWHCYFRRHKTWHDAKGFSEKEWHHGYLGLFCTVVGLGLIMLAAFQGIFTATNNSLLWFGGILLVFGIWNYWDDCAQHKRQKEEIIKYGKYRTMSFLHWVFEPLYPLWEALKRSQEM